ncbi:hypothetical protein LSH36_10g08016 [Paralvinella palmiformis]|uniref:Uncharacterized protein n=1 Tax=Paralvinella palmiformis TaxID=53620 RepID=A0AAD9KER2_9ANNE|nr:hypothetical protein LSH36_10g08016 [Paralvinella palmiformis]
MGTELHGHTKTVLCLSTAENGEIFSGGEQGELCLWSADGIFISKHTYQGDDDITSVICSQLHPNQLYAAAGTRILTLDKRQLSDPVCAFTFNEEEINELVLSTKEEYLAACDDSGSIKIINLFDRHIHRTLKKHSNICAALTFHPKRPSTLFSGGYDSKLIQWDYSRGRSVCIVEMADFGIHGGESNAYLINPPFVHCLAADSTGQYLACGIESALVQLFHINKRNPEHLVTLCGHTEGVSQVHFPRGKLNHLVSGGNDGKILIWDLEAIHQAGATCNGVSNGESSNLHLLPSNVANLPLATIDHGAKVNWLTSLSSNEDVRIIVADTLDRVILYPYPS